MKIWYCSYFWDCKGAVRAGQQLCVKCRDLGKMKNKLDIYYIDTMEIKRVRTIYCKGCFGRLLKSNVGTDEVTIRKQLTEISRKQDAN